MFDEQEPREHELAPELSALEGQLRGMTPASPRVDRDRMMFAAGQAATARDIGPFRAGNRFWPVATLTMTAATLLLAVMLVEQVRQQQVVQRMAPVQSPVVSNGRPSEAVAENRRRSFAGESWPAAPSAKSRYLGARYIALTRGVGALAPDFPSASGDGDDAVGHSPEPDTLRGLFKKLRPMTNSGDSSQSQSF